MSETEKSVLVGMSGGIDSTAVCQMLLQQGYRVVGLTFVTCDSGLYAAQSAALLAERLGIEHHMADIREEFRSLVIQPFIDDYLLGITPNPCVNCNLTVKFRILCEWADKLNCAKIATGHYVNVVTEESDSGAKHYLVTGDDDSKDQSYFLWRLSQQQLGRVLFPLGGSTKADVKEYLAENGFETLSRGGESMEVCFIPGDYRDFLKNNIPDVEQRIKPGSFVDSEGRVLGTHQGFPYYTIGQRKGLGIALGYPAYVIKINAAKNTVMLGEEQSLKTDHMLIEEPEWVNGIPYEKLTVRIRYRSRPIPCDTPVKVADGRYLVHLHTTASAITPGQSAVFYVGNKVVGGAFIASQRGINQWL